MLSVSYGFASIAGLKIAHVCDNSLDNVRQANLVVR